MAAAMDGHGFPKISVSLTKRQNKRISYESQRILGHVFSFSAGSRGDKRIREGKAKIFECLACLAKKGRLKRTLGAAGNSTPVARVRVSADLKHFVEDPETDKLIREHGCIEENVVVVKKEAPDEEELEEEFRRASGQVAGNRRSRKRALSQEKRPVRKMLSTNNQARRTNSRRRAPFEELNQRTGNESEGEREEEGVPSKRPRTVEEFPRITWSSTRTNLRKATYESVRFDGHVFSFREDASSRNRKSRSAIPKIFECLDCATLRSRRSRYDADCGNIARVRISANYKVFVADPDYSPREHQCVKLLTVNPPKGKGGRRSHTKTRHEPPEEEHEEEHVEEEEEEDEEEITNENQPSRALAISAVPRARRFHPNRNRSIVTATRPNWNRIQELKANFPFDYTDMFFAQESLRCDFVEHYFEWVHERFLQIVEEKHPTSKLKDFNVEWKKWKSALISATENMRNCNWKVERPVNDERAFRMVGKLFSERSIMQAAAIEIKIHYIMLKVAVASTPFNSRLGQAFQFRSCIGECSIFPRLVIVGEGEMQSRYIAISRQMIRLPESYPLAEALRIIVESYVVFDLSVCPEVAHVVVFLEFIYGLQRSQMTPSMHKFLKDTYESLCEDSQED